LTFRLVTPPRSWCDHRRSFLKKDRLTDARLRISEDIVYSKVRYPGHRGKHLHVLSFTGFDPEPDSRERSMGVLSSRPFPDVIWGMLVEEV
jgi:hypothetical protein